MMQMKSENKKLILLILIFFLVGLYADKKYEEWKGERPVPNRFKNDAVYESPTYTTNGLYYLDGYLWISSGHDHQLLKYDLSTQQVVKSLDIPATEAAGLTYDGENFWVCDYSKRTLCKISPEGDILGSYVTPYSTPYGVTWDGTNLWILDVFGLEEYPRIFEGVYPNALLYKFVPESNTVLDVIDSPTPFAGDIAYKNGELLITGCTSRMVYHLDVRTRMVTDWYYPPDSFPRAIAVGEGNTHFVSGWSNRKIWLVNLDKKAQFKDLGREDEAIIPFWLVIITLLLLLPVALDEFLKKPYVEESFLETLYYFITSRDVLAFFLKAAVVSVLIYYISNYFFLRRITALATQALLARFGISSSYLTFGNVIFLDGFSIEKSCLSLIFVSLATGALFATRASLKEKVILSFLGFCILFVWNVARLSIFITLTYRNVPQVLAHDIFFLGGGLLITVAVLKICSILSPEVKRDFSSIWNLIQEEFISRQSNVA